MSQFDVTVYIKPEKLGLVSQLFDKIKEEFQTEEYSSEIFDDVIMFHYKIDALENKHKYEDFLDHLRTEYDEYKKLRYIIKIYEPNKPHPESVRINKQFKKIKTKQQTKYLGF